MNKAELSKLRAKIKRQLEKESEARSERHKQFNLALINSDDKTARRYLALVYYDIMCEDFVDRMNEDEEFSVGLDDDVE